MPRPLDEIESLTIWLYDKRKGLVRLELGYREQIFLSQTDRLWFDLFPRIQTRYQTFILLHAS